MRKRSPNLNSRASAESPSSLSSSSSSCVVDYHHHDRDRDRDHDNQQNEVPKPKRGKRKRASINSNSKEKCPNTNTTTTNTKRSSIYRGVTRHRWTGRFEAHLWDKTSWNNSQNKKGRQVYLGAYDSEVDAARTYDLAALKYWGPETTLNFPIENYAKEFDEMQNASKEEYLASLRRRSSGFSRGVSKYRGVARHHHNGRWEARIGQVFGNKYLYLGTFSSQEEAAAAYDLAAIQYRGPNAVTNFDISNYIGRIKNLMPKSEQSQPLNLSQTKTIEHQQQQQIRQQNEGEEEQEERDQCRMQEQGNSKEVKQDEQMEMPSKFGELKLVGSVSHDSSMLVIGPNDEDDNGNPWSFCLDNGEYDPLLVLDAPLEEEGRVLDLFDQAGFEENIDLIFEGEGGLINVDEMVYSNSTEDVGCQMRIKASEDLNKENENSTSFSTSSPSSPSSVTSLVPCQL